MLDLRMADRGFDPEPVAHQIHFTERNSRLCHPPRSGVHAQKHDFLRPGSVPLEVQPMRLPGVVERIVDVRYRRLEFESRNRPAQIPRNANNRRLFAAHWSDTTSDSIFRNRSISSCVV